MSNKINELFYEHCWENDDLQEEFAEYMSENCVEFACYYGSRDYDGISGYEDEFDESLDSEDSLDEDSEDNELTLDSDDNELKEDSLELESLLSDEDELDDSLLLLDSELSEESELLESLLSEKEDSELVELILISSQI